MGGLESTCDSGFHLSTCFQFRNFLRFLIFILVFGREKRYGNYCDLPNEAINWSGQRLIWEIPVQKPYGFGIRGVETQKHGSRMRINSPGQALNYETDRIDAFLPFRQLPSVQRQGDQDDLLSEVAYPLMTRVVVAAR